MDTWIWSQNLYPSSFWHMKCNSVPRKQSANFNACHTKITLCWLALPPKSFWKILFCKSSNKSSNSNTERNQHTLFFNCACSLHPNLDDFVTLNSTEEMKTQPASRLQMCSMFMPVSLPWMHQGTLHIVKKKKGGQKGSRFSCSLWLAKVNTDAWMKWVDKLAELIQSRLVYIGPPLNTTCHLSARNM